MVFIKMLQTKTAIDASRAIRNDFIQPKFLFKSNTMQPCLSNYTIPRVVELKTIVPYCRRKARFPVHGSPPRKFQECAARFLICPAFICEIPPCKLRNEKTICGMLSQAAGNCYTIRYTMLLFHSLKDNNKNITLTNIVALSV